VRFNGKGIDGKAALRTLFRFYETELQAYLLDRIEDMERLTGLAAVSYRVRAYKSKWGSCSPEGVVSFNLKLAAFQSEIVDYVIIHELCHLRHRNHSKAFWRLVGKYMGDVQERRALLRREAKNHEFV
jgi:predicted metal-dependent hydrolase